MVVPISKQFIGRKANLTTGITDPDFPKKSRLTITDVKDSMRGLTGKIYTEVIETNM